MLDEILEDILYHIEIDENATDEDIAILLKNIEEECDFFNEVIKCNPLENC